ncbi:hypothetical protein [Candidatus Chloroploca sp. Khr17]|uniref:hypothetical protein n=1 Tax=Candidatus Chloroploca sp. Khr17 TaxID=2496869 RepID=UPI00101B81F3|nr:hypothetical protein [Candidatus Chloroploca sp. Khr17]
MTYETIMRRLLGLACLLAPALQVLSALLYLAGNLAWEAVVGMYAWTFTVAMYQGVAMTIGRSKPVYGAVVAVIGFLNAVGVAAYTMRMAGLMMVELGLFESQAQIFAAPSVVPAFNAYGLLGLFGALTPAICAVGLLQARAIPAWAAGALIVSTVSFLLAQVREVAYSVTYPLYGLLMLAGFAPVGLALLRGEPGALSATQVRAERV